MNIRFKEVLELKGGNEAYKVNSGFFAVLEKVQGIRLDAKVSSH